jgi:nucleotide-binding universal stress UspA family protein
MNAREFIDSKGGEIMTYNKVMVAFDGSEGSIRALKHVIFKSDIANSQLVVVTVINGQTGFDSILSEQMGPGQTMAIGSGVYPFSVQAPPLVDAEKAEMHRKHKESEIRKNGEKVLASAKELLKQYNAQSDVEVLEGNVAERLCEHAETHDFDLIVIGHRGLSGIKKLVLGSVSQKVVQESNCPVLVVK